VLHRQLHWSGGHLRGRSNDRSTTYKKIINEINKTKIFNNINTTKSVRNFKKKGNEYKLSSGCLFKASVLSNQFKPFFLFNNFS
jgi:hypothetical protein